ncbi:TIGR03643 family protein [Francisella tularensis subsp. holarctica]|uniref:TIGR03643 family protein n=1 Tax=Francisella tularensis TaxID=263 RepID=UPI002381A9F6|nr:TIGR03643 family protein [Francisella tularensis]MDE5005204.1 TIGR03643 family protein [Francisella tularensis subsp. holarctica]
MCLTKYSRINYKTSFVAIKETTGLSEPQVIKIMLNNLKPSSFKLWRKRVTERFAKHQKRLNHINVDSLV